MDTQTAFATATLMTIINGGVLGLLYQELPDTLRAAARSWLNGTLLIAGGSLVFVLQSLFPLPLMVVLANGGITLGFTAYWLSLRQFYNDPPHPLMVVPTIVGLLALFWYSAVTPHTAYRVVISTVVWTIIFGGCLHTLLAQGHRDTSHGRQVLIAVFALLLVFTWTRTGYLALVAGVEPDYSIISNSWINLLTPMLVATLPVVGTTVFVLMCSERLRRQWERAASTDFLTGLANRRSLTDAGNERLAGQDRKDGRMAVALIDIDYFKAVNDAYGHEVGDVALRHVARVLENSVRSNELAARLGGEEFVVLLDNIDAASAQIAGERLRCAVETHPFRTGRLNLPLTVSIGIALQEPGERDFNTLLKRADKAMYMAKNDGRNRVVVADNRGTNDTQ
jgi:diguanylate cyclase (GGDEF)-like protein